MSGLRVGLRSLLVACVVTGLLAPGAQAAPSLSKRQAQSYLRTALNRNFGDLFKNRASYSPGCHRRTRSHFRCDVGWAIGDYSFAGTAHIWTGYKTVDDGPKLDYWYYSYRITRTDEYCADVEHGKHCTKTYVVR